MRQTKQGLNLNRVVLLGRTLEEYCRFFALNLEGFRGQKILDVAAGVSSFTAEANARGFDATAFDVIYQLSPEEIRKRCEHDLGEVASSIGDKPVYKWDFYKSAEGMRAFRALAYQTFLSDFEKNSARYVAGELPRTPFADGHFDLTLVSYLLFVYEDQLSLDFHKASLRELMRVTSGEIRIYPLVTFEAEPSNYLEVLRGDPDFASWRFEEIATDFEFLRGSNRYLSIRRR